MSDKSDWNLFAAERDSALPGNLRNQYDALQNWAADAATVSGNWATMTTVQRNNAHAALFDRFGKLCTGLSILVRQLGMTD